MAGADRHGGVEQLAWSGASSFSYIRLLLFVFVGMTEGFDVQAMAFAAPLVSVEMALTSTQVGWLLSSSVIGLVVGSFLLSPFGDRLGRRPCIFIGLTAAAISTGLGAFMPDAVWLAVVRFIAGASLGMALPNVIALASEVVPPRIRVTAIVLVGAGYPLGAALGGFIASGLIPTFGYAAVFLIGCSGTLLALVLCVALAPESPEFLLGRPERADELQRLLKRLGATLREAERLILPDRRSFKANLAELFSPARRKATLLLWLVSVGNIAMVYFYVNWLPSLLVKTGASPANAVKASALFQLSGVLGGLLLSVLMSRVGARRVLGIAYAIAIVTALLLARDATLATGVMITLAVAGAVVAGSQFCLTAVINQYYPTDIRTTATGYASGMGRLGAIAAPIAGGVALGIVDVPSHAFTLAVVPGVAALIGILLLDRGIDRSIKAK